MGSDPDKMFPFETLLDQLRQLGKYGTMVGAILMVIFFSDPNEASENRSEAKDAFEIPEGSKEKYFTTLRDMIEDASRFGYL